MLVYYAHERMWNKVPFGFVSAPLDANRVSQVELSTKPERIGPGASLFGSLGTASLKQAEAGGSADAEQVRRTLPI